MKLPRMHSEALELVQQLAAIVGSMESHIVALDEDRSNNELLTVLVQEILEVKRISGEISHTYLPFLDGEEAAPSFRQAISLAHDLLMGKARGVSQDLEVLTKTKKRPTQLSLVG